MVTESLQNELVTHLWHRVAPGIDEPAVIVEGPVTLDSAYAVNEFAAASIAVAGMAASLISASAKPNNDAESGNGAQSGDGAESGNGAQSGNGAESDEGSVVVDRPLAAAWFQSAVKLATPLDPWDAIAGDYATSDGWIRLHTNAPHHKAAALRVLGVTEDRAAVAAEVARWRADELEEAVVAEGGCAARMRSWTEWADHPQGAAVAAEPLIEWTEGAAGTSTGFRVLDLTRVIAGPVATRLLAGFGADVLRIDPPDWHETAIEPDMTLGKRTARLDLTTDAGLATLRELASGADVVVHGYRADALEKLGLDFGRIRPGIVDVAIDAYGWSGPWRNRRGFDSLVQMSTGIAEEGMRWYGTDKPKPLPVQALDHSTGYLAAAAALVGLARARETGVGSRARLSLARTALELAGVGRGEEAEQAPLQVGSHLATPWGSAQLLPSPVTVCGVAPTWQRGPRPLGSDAPQWVE